jgi:hypothetical protein
MSEQTDQPVAETEEAPPEDAEVTPADTGPDPNLESQFARARDMGITGDPDAEPGYVVDPDFVPNPLDVGTLRTDEIHGISAYDITRHAGVFDPTFVTESPFQAEVVPQAVATDYDPSAAAGVLAEVSPQESPQAATTRQAEVAAAGTGASGTATEVEAAPQQPAVVEEEAPPEAAATTRRASRATKGAPAPSPADTRDSTLEPPPEAPQTP